MNSSLGQNGLVSIGLVTWNNAGELPLTLEGIRQQTHPALEVIVVDNASSDQSLELVRLNVPEAKLIANQENLGYCKAHNQAIEMSRGEYYLALNPDVQMAPDFCGSMVAALEHRPEYGSVAGKLWRPGGQEPKVLDATALFIDRRRHQYLRGHGELDRGQFDQAEDVFGADGAAPLFRRAMLEDVKVFGQVYDEQFFGYMEDVDLAWRAKLYGWKCWYEPSATAFHDRTFRPGQRKPMTKEVRRTSVKNRYLTLLKNESMEGWRRDWWQILWYDLKILSYLLLIEQSSLGAIPTLWEQKDGALAWRRDIWRRVKATPRERLTWFE